MTPRLSPGIGFPPDQVPVLGRLPLIGALFRQGDTGTSRTRFFVFIRPTVMRARGFEDLKHISVREALHAEVRDGWPIVPPRIIR